MRVTRVKKRINFTVEYFLCHGAKNVVDWTPRDSSTSLEFRKISIKQRVLHFESTISIYITVPKNFVGNFCCCKIWASSGKPSNTLHDLVFHEGKFCKALRKIDRFEVMKASYEINKSP